MNGYRIWMTVAAAMLLIGGEMPALADTTEATADERIATEASVAVGYRSVSVHGEPGRASEYDSLKSSPLFNVKLFTDPGGYHLDLGLDYLNEDDYRAEFHLDTKGLLRLDLRSERFWHNLDHIPYNNGQVGAPSDLTDSLDTRTTGGEPADGSRPDGIVPHGYKTFYTDENPGDDYGLRLDIYEAKLKIKCPDYPAHVNLSYWRYEKHGDKQLRFNSEGGVDGSCTGCHMQSKTRDINRVTEEVKVSADAHAGFVDVVLEGLYRTFHDKEDIPFDFFGDHDRGRQADWYEHDEDPDSRVKEATLRLNTAPSGGLVGNASFTIGERENRSDLDSVSPVDAETDYTKTTADVTYTPSQNWTFNLRYRLLDLDSDNSDAISDDAGGAFLSPLSTREPMDITRAWYEAVANYRPTPRLSLKAEFRREEIDRSDTGETEHPFHSPGTPDPWYWNLPEEEIITRVKLGFSSRLLEKSALKLSGWVAVQQNDDPAYGTSFNDSQELFLSASYNPSPAWGFLASLNLLDQEGNDFGIESLEINLSAPGGATYEIGDETGLDRNKKQQNLSIGTWFVPREGLSFDLNYGYLRTAIDQDLLFGRVNLLGVGDYRIEEEEAEYRQSVQTVTLGATWQPRDNLNCRLEGYHIRSKAQFDPEFASGPYLYYFQWVGTATSDDLREISQVDIRQNGLRARVNWQIDEKLSCSAEATFDDYDEKGSDVFDGSVQSYMAGLSYAF